MARTTPLLLGMLLLLVAFAGCLGGDDEPAPGTEGEDEDEDPQPTETHGVVRGNLVTADDLRPLRGASINLIQNSELIQQKTSNDQGQYVFRDVEPGGYHVQVSAVCCREQIRSIQVKAGEETTASFQLERLEVPVIHDPYVDTDGEWTGLINCGLTTAETGALYPAACQQGGHDVREIVFFGPGVRSITMELTWDAAATGLGAEEMRLTAHNLNAKFELIGEAEGASPLTLQVQNLDLADDKRFDLFDDAGWVARFAITPLSAGGAVLYQQSFTLRYHVHYWEQAPPTYTVADAATGGGESTGLRGINPLQPQAMEEPNEPQEGPNGDCMEYNALYLVGAHSPLMVTVELEADTGYVIDSSMGLVFVDFFTEDGDWIGWSLYRHYGNVPADAAYAVVCIGMLGEYPDVPEPFATWFYMDGFPTFSD